MSKILNEIDLISTQKSNSEPEFENEYQKDFDNFIKEYLDSQKSYFENLKNFILNKNFLKIHPFDFFKGINTKKLTKEEYIGILNIYASNEILDKININFNGLIFLVKDINIDFLTADEYYDFLNKISSYCEKKELINDLIDLIPVIKNKNIYDRKYFEYLKRHLLKIINYIFMNKNYDNIKIYDAILKIKFDYYNNEIIQNALSLQFGHLANQFNPRLIDYDNKENFIHTIYDYLEQTYKNLIYNHNLSN